MNQCDLSHRPAPRPDILGLAIGSASPNLCLCSVPKYSFRLQQEERVAAEHEKEIGQDTRAVAKVLNGRRRVLGAA
jgi:hypothetical protein